MLGERQVAWLEEQLDAARAAPLVVWVNTVPWITKRNESTREGWASYAPRGGGSPTTSCGWA